MKKLILLLCFVLTSCYIPEPQEGPIDNTGPIIVNPPSNGGNVTTQSLVGTTWRIFYYRVGPTSQVMSTNDTLVFLTSSIYTFNGQQSTYYLTPTGSGYNLTLYETTWGNLSGSILSNNITNGTILGTKFVDISVGSSNTTEYYLWMNK
ncbi:MAG: hypothetical protein EBS55_14175, partial [Flavobacteriaceae bacterium]|nr:hypothetical protein [Flavobacteriaceae bacterium]